MPKTFATIDRISRWILLVLMFLFIFTGFGITKGIMNPKWAKQLHENFLPIPFYALFLVHIFYKVPIHLVRWNIFERETTAAVYMYALATILLGLFLWLHFR